MTEEHKHAYEIHYTAVDWQNPLFIKCLACGSTYHLARKPVLLSAEKLADAAESILFHLPTQIEWDELRNAWQAYVDVAPDEDSVASYGASKNV